MKTSCRRLLKSVSDPLTGSKFIKTRPTVLFRFLTSELEKCFSSPIAVLSYWVIAPPPGVKIWNVDRPRDLTLFNVWKDEGLQPIRRNWRSSPFRINGALRFCISQNDFNSPLFNPFCTSGWLSKFSWNFRLKQTHL